VQEQDYTVFCLPISPTDNDYATIGREYIAAYPMKHNHITFSFISAEPLFLFSSVFCSHMYSDRPVSGYVIFAIYMITLILADIDYCLSFDTFVSENYLMGYRMVFDRENLRFGWSRWNCEYFLTHNFPKSS